MRNISDYLHLYVRSRCACYIDGFSSPIGGKAVLCANTYALIMDLTRDSNRVIKLGLRPLSTMTAAELDVLLCAKHNPLGFSSIVMELGDGVFYYKIHQVHKKKGSRRISARKKDIFPLQPSTPEQVRVALQLGFDIFGLIEAGLAIDVTKT